MPAENLASDESLKKICLEQKRRLEKIKQRLAESEAEADSLRGHAAFLKILLKENKKDLEDVRARLEKALVKNVLLEKESQILNHKPPDSGTALKEAKSNEERLKARIEKYIDLLSLREKQLVAFQEYQSRFQKAQENVRVLEADLGAKKEELVCLKERQNGAESAIDEKKRHNEQLERAVQFLRERNEETQLETKNLEEELLTSQSLLDETRRQLKEVLWESAALKEYKNATQGLAEKNGSLQKENDEFKNRLECQAEEIDKLKIEARDIQEAEEETRALQGQFAELKLTIAAALKTKEALAHQLEESQSTALTRTKAQEELRGQQTTLIHERNALEEEVRLLRNKYEESETKAMLAKQHLGKKVKETTLLSESLERSCLENQGVQSQLKEAQTRLSQAQNIQEQHRIEKQQLEARSKEATLGLEARVQELEGRCGQLQDAMQKLDAENRELVQQKEKLDQLQGMLKNLGMQEVPPPPKETPYKNLFDYNQPQSKIKSNFLNEIGMDECILGIDPGTRITGYGLIRLKHHGLEALDFGCIRPSPALSLHDKYLLIHQGVCELIDTFKPMALAIETQFVKLNPASALKLGMARGSIIIAARLRGVPVFEYAPSVAKKAITGSGRASKEQVQGMIQKLLMLGQIPEPEDAADALSIAVCHAHRIRRN